MLTCVFYLKKRSATAVVYLPTSSGVRALSFRIGRSEISEEVLAKTRKRWVVGSTEGVSVRVSEGDAARILLKVPNICNSIFYQAVDKVIKAAFSRNEVVKAAVLERARRKAGDLASSYVSAWLKADERYRLPRDDPDARAVAQHSSKLVWLAGDKYVVQVLPWCP